MIVLIVNYTALGLLFAGSAYMHVKQVLDKFVYFCYVVSSVIFVYYAILLIDSIFFIQNCIFLLFDTLGIFRMMKKRGREKKDEDMTCESYAGVMRGFYRHNGYRIDVYIPKQDSKKQKISLTKELIKKVLLNTQKLRDKVIILIMTSSGMSIEDVLDLEYRNVKNLGSSQRVIFRRVKNNQEYITYFSSECIEYLNEYLRIKRKLITDNEKLFRNSWKTDLNYDTFYKVLNVVSNKVVGNNQINTKAFRRFFITEMKLAGVPVDIVEFWVGHSIGVRKDYLNDGKMDELYKQHEAVVTIFKELDNKKINEIREEIETEVNKKLEVLYDRVGQLESILKLLFDDKLKK